MDFDDLLVNAVRAVPDRTPTCWPTTSSRFQHVLVDEYQDTNRVQNELVAAAGARSTATSASSATPTSRSTSSGAPTSATSSSSRRPSPTPPSWSSTRTTGPPRRILDAANAVIANNFGRKPKDLWTEQGAGEKIVRYHADDETDEAQWVANQTRTTSTTEENYRWGDLAIFYRTNAQSRVIEEHLMRVGIPYQVIGGTRFYDRREVKDAMAYLKAVVNPIDEVSVKRILNVPKRGIGDSHHRPPRRVGQQPGPGLRRRPAPAGRGRA